jgi:hypothetical protein
MGVRRVERDGRIIARFNGEASAGVDLDRNRPAEGDVVEFAFAFKLQRAISANQQVVLATTGGGDRPLRIVIDGRQPQTVQVRVDGKLTPVAPFAPQAWTPVHMRISADQCAVAAGDATAIALPLPTDGTWLFLGQGYLEDLVSARLAFEVDVATVRSRVVHD